MDDDFIEAAIKEVDELLKEDERRGIDEELVRGRALIQEARRIRQQDTYLFAIRPPTRFDN